MNQPPKLLDVVALLRNFPDKKLFQGQVGTIVEILAPHTYEIEFSDQRGKTIATLGVKEEDFLVLRYELAEAV